jgi:hypothetical protein
MTDVGVKYDRFFGRSVMGFGWPLPVRRSSLRADGICAILFRFEYKGLSSGGGEGRGAGSGGKLLWARAKGVLKKVENRLHS